MCRHSCWWRRISCCCCCCCCRPTRFASTRHWGNQGHKNSKFHSCAVTKLPRLKALICSWLSRSFIFSVWVKLAGVGSKAAPEPLTTLKLCHWFCWCFWSPRSLDPCDSLPRSTRWFSSQNYDCQVHSSAVLVISRCCSAWIRRKFRLSHTAPVNPPMETSNALDHSFLQRNEVILAEAIYNRCDSALQTKGSELELVVSRNIKKHEWHLRRQFVPCQFQISMINSVSSCGYSISTH